MAIMTSSPKPIQKKQNTQYFFKCLFINYINTILMNLHKEWHSICFYESANAKVLQEDKA